MPGMPLPLPCPGNLEIKTTAQEWDTRTPVQHGLQAAFLLGSLLQEESRMEALVLQPPPSILPRPTKLGIHTPALPKSLFFPETQAEQNTTPPWA